MESGTGSSEDSSICGLRDISGLISKCTDQKGIFGSEFDTIEEHNPSEELQGILDDGNLRRYVNFVVSYQFSCTNTYFS